MPCPYIWLCLICTNDPIGFALLIKHDLVHSVWSPLVELTRVRHVQFRTRLLRRDETRLMAGSIVSGGV